MATLVSYYAADLLRGDGYPVRLARLGMLQPAASWQFAACWVIECCFALAFLSVGRWPRLVTVAACLTVYLCFAALLSTAFGLI